MKTKMLTTLILAVTVASASRAEVLFWEPFDYAPGTVLSATSWYNALYNWPGNNGVVANDAVLDSGNYLKNTSAIAGRASGYEMHLNKRVLAADEAAELTFVVRREPGKTSPEIYLCELNGGWYYGSPVTPVGKTYFLSPMDAWGSHWWFAAGAGQYVYPGPNFVGVGSIVDCKIRVTRNDCSFWWRNHGVCAWNLINQYVGAGADSVQKIRLVLYSDMLPAADGFDSVKLEVVPSELPPDCGITSWKKLPDGTLRDLVAAEVTVDTGDCFFVEDADRSSGIRVSQPVAGDLFPGMRVTVAGRIETDSNGERYIAASEVTVAGGDVSIEPLGMTGKALGGGNWFYDPASGAGQVGVTGGSGLNNVGLLVKVWGKPVLTGSSDSYEIDDGSGVDVTVQLPPGQTHGWTSDNLPAYVTAVGASGLRKIGSVYAPVVYTTDLGSPNAPGGLTVVNNGVSDYKIVVSATVSLSEDFAAQELASYISQMSGAYLPIITDTSPLPKHAIVLGDTSYSAPLGATPDWAQLDKEGFLIRTLGERLVIAGCEPRGTMYGVYDILEKYWGCHWFTFDTTQIPSKPTLSLPDLNVTHRPPFDFRGVAVVGGNYGEWFSDRRGNEDAYVARNRWTFWWGPAENHGGNFNIPYFGHNYRYLVDPAVYGTTHPEYYALDENGNRMNYIIPGTSDVELCLTNPGTAQAAADFIAQYLRGHPDADMAFVGQSDTPYYCKCVNCAAKRQQHGGWDSARQVEIPGDLPAGYWEEYGGFGGWQLDFLNRIAQLLEAEFPDTPVGTYAYWRQRRPPRGITAHGNVEIMYCPLKAGFIPQRCYDHPVNAGPVNNDFENFGAELQEWKRIASHASVYDYWLGTWFGQPVNISTLGQTMRFYRDAGVEGMFLDGIRGLPAGFEWLTLWLWNQLAWNPDFDAVQGVDEFCSAYYGAAAPYIKQYIQLASSPDSYELTSRPDIYSGPWATYPDHTTLYTTAPYMPIAYDSLGNCLLLERVMKASAIDQGYSLFQSARSAVAGNPVLEKHVEYSRMALQYAMCEWLPCGDTRLTGEVESLIQLATELGIPNIGYQAWTHDQYRSRISTKIVSCDGEVLFWEPFDYAPGTVLSTTSWYNALYNWPGNNGVVANDAVLDSGNYLKNTVAGQASGYEMHLNKRVLAADEAAELTFVLRRQPGNTSPEIYLCELNYGWLNGSPETPVGKAYFLSPMDAWGSHWWFTAGAGQYVYPGPNFVGVGSIVDCKIRVTRNDCSFWWRNHGTSTWNLINQYIGAGADSVQKIRLALYSDTSPADGIDSVKLAVVRLP